MFLRKYAVSESAKNPEKEGKSLPIFKLSPSRASKIFTYNIWSPLSTFQEYQETGPKEKEEKVGERMTTHPQ